jgi:phosphoglycerate kinase
MAKLTIRDLDLEGSRLFVRVDFNVPIYGGKVGDDLRLREALPTIRYALERNAVVILASHLGRPKGQADPRYSLAPVAERLGELLEKPVRFLSTCVGPEVENAVAAARPGDLLLLENLRFHPEEEANDPRFAKKLGKLAPLYVNDAFGSAHRAHASTHGITRHVERAAAGLLLEKELRYLGEALDRPERPFVAVLGGAKISGKIEVIENLLPKVDHLLIGGAMMFTFLRVRGARIGKSVCEEDKLALAEDLLARAGPSGRSPILLPIDAVAARSLEDEASAHVVAADQIPDDEIGVDIGPETVQRFSEILGESKTIVWNGPLGVFEKDGFASGTIAVARAVAASGAVSIVGGGDSAAAVVKAGVAERITHVSTGGGASLEFLAGRTLPGVAALSDRAD